jgi:hypothetical protein
MNLPTPAVLAAVEGLYVAFAVYPLPDWTGPCLHCHSADEERQLHESPLRKLSAEQLRAYAGDALLVWGDEPIFKHFLPRLAEIFVTASQPSLELQDPEILLSKFRHGNWLTWPPEEQAATRAFLLALWRAVLAGPPPIDEHWLDMESWLCSIAQAEDDLNPYLQVWLAEMDGMAGVALGQFICDSGVAHRQETGRNPYWKDREAPYKQVRAWIRSEAVRMKLMEAEARISEAEGKGQVQAALSELGVD